MIQNSLSCVFPQIWRAVALHWRKRRSLWEMWSWFTISKITVMMLEFEGDTLDRSFICEVEKQNMKAPECVDDRPLIVWKMPHIAALIACEQLAMSWYPRPHPTPGPTSLVEPPLIPLNLLPLFPSLLGCQCGMRETLQPRLRLLWWQEGEKKGNDDSLRVKTRPRHATTWIDGGLWDVVQPSDR